MPFRTVLPCKQGENGKIDLYPRTVLPCKQEENDKTDLYPRTVLQLYPLIGVFLIANTRFLAYNIYVQLLSLTRRYLHFIFSFLLPI